MNKNINNPFDITKAVDYTDDEIYRYWVDLNKAEGFYGFMKPENPMPMIIVGSKGSGKTHIMKYFSYELQKIRDKKHANLKDDKFIGVYIRCSGFNSDKFSGKGVSDSIWSALYAYYWELWIGERILSIVIDLYQNGYINELNEKEIINDVLILFLSQQKEINSLSELRNYFLKLQKDVEYESQNFIFEGKDIPEVSIPITKSCLTYGLPLILRNKIPFFKDKKILYLIDELENFSEIQQQLIQSLIREKPNYCTFRVGTRPYGIRTYKILGGIEENHDGSEFEKIILEDFLRTSKDYEKYVIDICERRLMYSDISFDSKINLQELIEEQTNEETLDKISKKKESQSKSYFTKLRRDIKSYTSYKDTYIDDIINNLTFKKDVIIERTNVVLLYRSIKDKCTDIISESKKIQNSAYAYYNHQSSETEQEKYISKYKQDIIDTLAREGREHVPYFGLKKLINLSCGTPRTILRLLKAAFNVQYFATGKIPFANGNKLSINSQKLAIENTYNWFFEENRIPSSGQYRATDAIKRLGDYLQSLRFSDLPPECSIRIFSLSENKMSDKAREVFDLLKSYSYIIKISERRMKNSDSIESVFTLNNILIPKWELSLNSRGMITLLNEEAELIFNPDNQQNYDNYIKLKIKQYSFPFNTSYKQKNLFDF